MESAAKAPLKAAGRLSRDGGDACAVEGLRAASSNRLTCTADHLPPRAAGMPRSSRPAAMARRDSQPAARSP
jgi:hypothetical protein